MRRGFRRSFLLLLAGALLVGACVQIDGGAVEARWDLQYGIDDCTPPGASDPLCKRGNRTSCALSNIATIEFVLTPVRGGKDPCLADPGVCRFDCERKVGTTTFFAPEADYSISLRARDPEGKILGPADGLTAPPPILRQVRTGELTNLNVNLIIVETCLGC